MKQYSLLVLYVFSVFTAWAQTSDIEPYKLHRATDITVTASAAGLVLLSEYLKQNKQPLTATDLAALNRNDVWRFDRPATYNWSPSSALASDILVNALMVMPFAHFATATGRQNYKPLLVMHAQTILATIAITSMTKEFVQRPRPFTYNPDAPLDKKLKPDATSSFFSQHTGLSSAMCFYTAQTFSDLYPNSRLKPVVWTSAFVVPAFVGYLRWNAGRHFFTDISTGYVVGALVGIGVPTLHKYLKQHSK